MTTNLLSALIADLAKHKSDVQSIYANVAAISGAGDTARAVVDLPGIVQTLQSVTQQVSTLIQSLQDQASDINERMDALESALAQVNTVIQSLQGS